MIHRLSKHNMQKKILARRIYQNWYCGVATYITKSLQMSEETNNPVYKLKTDKLAATGAS